MRENFNKRAFFKRNILFIRWRDQRLAGFCVDQRADFGILKEPLGIRLGASRFPHELGKSGANECDRQLVLRAFVQRRNERCKLALFDVLQLVDEKNDRSVFFLCRASNLKKDINEIVFQISAVRRTRLITQFNAKLNVLVFHFHGADESAEDA